MFLCVFCCISQGRYQNCSFFGKIQLCPDVGRNSISVINGGNTVSGVFSLRYCYSLWLKHWEEWCSWQEGNSQCERPLMAFRQPVWAAESSGWCFSSLQGVGVGLVGFSGKDFCLEQTVERLIRAGGEIHKETVSHLCSKMFVQETMPMSWEKKREKIKRLCTMPDAIRSWRFIFRTYFLETLLQIISSV